MELIYLKTLVAAIECGSFSKAADTLCVTQSAVSRRIKFLEDQYGYCLVDRSGPALLPTESGQLVVDKAKLLLRIEQELVSGLKEIEEQTRITFCCTPSFGIAFLPQILKEFMLLNADLSNLKFFFNMPENVVKGLQEGRYDLAVIEHCACLNLTEFKTAPLPSDEMIFISSPALGINGGVTSIDTLITHRLYSRNEGCCSKTLLDANMQRIARDSSEFGSIIIYDDLHLIIKAVVEGEGIAFISDSVVKHQLASGTLKAHHVEGFNHTRHRTFVLNDLRKPDQAQHNFMQEVFATFNLPVPSFA